MGPIITEVAVWLPGLFARESGLTSHESDLQIVCLLPGLAVIDSGWFSGLLAADMGQSPIFMYGLAIVCLACSDSHFYIQEEGSRRVKRLAQVHTAC